MSGFNIDKARKAVQKYFDGELKKEEEGKKQEQNDKVRKIQEMQEDLKKFFDFNPTSDNKAYDKVIEQIKKNASIGYKKVKILFLDYDDCTQQNIQKYRKEHGYFQDGLNEFFKPLLQKIEKLGYSVRLCIHTLSENTYGNTLKILHERGMADLTTIYLIVEWEE